MGYQAEDELREKLACIEKELAFEKLAWKHENHINKMRGREIAWLKDVIKSWTSASEAGIIVPSGVMDDAKEYEHCDVDGHEGLHGVQTRLEASQKKNAELAQGVRVLVEAIKKYQSECQPHPCPDLPLRLHYKDQMFRVSTATAHLIEPGSKSDKPSSVGRK